jgi:putative tricarboxylic transport membrane protein
MSDRILGLIGLLLAAFYAYSATLIEESFITDPVGPKTFPIIVAGVFALCSLYFILRPDPEPQWTGARSLFDVALAAGVMFAYAALLPELGFILSTFIATLYLAYRLGATPLETLGIALGTSLGLYVVFRLVLGLSLAHGPLGF